MPTVQISPNCSPGQIVAAIRDKMQISPGFLLLVVGGGGGDLENSPFVETLEASVWEL